MPEDASTEQNKTIKELAKEEGISEGTPHNWSRLPVWPGGDDWSAGNMHAPGVQIFRFLPTATEKNVIGPFWNKKYLARHCHVKSHDKQRLNNGCEVF